MKIRIGGLQNQNQGLQNIFTNVRNLCTEESLRVVQLISMAQVNYTPRKTETGQIAVTLCLLCLHHREHLKERRKKLRVAKEK